MDYLQQRKNDTRIDESPKFLRLALGINFLLVILIFVLNYLGSPLLKYAYLITVLFSIWAAIFLNFINIMPILFTIYFIEGQGRIIWDNASWTKFIFDAVVLLSVFKILIINKKIYNIKKIPRLLITLIILHLIWYVFAIFNLDTISIFAAIAASKLYVYPILFFFALSQIEFEVESIHFQKFLNYFIFLLSMEIVLIFFQYYLREKFLLQISPSYQIAMKDLIFSGSFFRPFGTSFAPGSISVFFYLTLGLLFLKRKTLWTNIIFSLIIPLSFIAIVICQVRSALLKYALIFLLIQIGNTIFKRFKGKEVLKLTIIVATFIWGIIYIANLDFSLNSRTKDTNDINKSIETVRNRFTTLSDEKILKSSRIGITDFVQIAKERLIDKPFGHGPGFTGILGRLGITGTGIKSEEFWASDNLYVALLIELGIGSIFYILILFFIPIYFFQFLVKFYILKKEYEFNVILICFSSLAIIVLGNWGVVGITYNPESFIFWFFAALGFTTISKYKKADSSHEKLPLT